MHRHAWSRQFCCSRRLQRLLTSMTLAAVAVIYTKLSSIFSFRPVRLYTLSDRSARPVVRSLGQADESGRRSERVNASSDRSSRLWADRSGRRSQREKRPVIRLGGTFWSTGCNDVCHLAMNKLGIAKLLTKTLFSACLPLHFVSVNIAVR